MALIQRERIAPTKISIMAGVKRESTRTKPLSARTKSSHGSKKRAINKITANHAVVAKELFTQFFIIHRHIPNGVGRAGGSYEEIKRGTQQLDLESVLNRIEY